MNLAFAGESHMTFPLTIGLAAQAGGWIPSMGFSTGGVPWKSLLLASRRWSTRGLITRQFLRLRHGIPSHDNFSRVLRRLDSAPFQACFVRFHGALRRDAVRRGGNRWQDLAALVRPVSPRQVAPAHGARLGRRSAAVLRCSARSQSIRSPTRSPTPRLECRPRSALGALGSAR